MIQAHFFYSGNVQGVGFRFTAQQFAVELSLVGWIRNLADGRVELLVEGEDQAVDRLDHLLRDQFDRHISDVDVEKRKPEGAFVDFRIKYS